MPALWAAAGPRKEGLARYMGRSGLESTAPEPVLEPWGNRAIAGSDREHLLILQTRVKSAGRGQLGPTVQPIQAACSSSPTPPSSPAH
jgi:hypothetical protein